MKKIIIYTAAALLVAGLSGCQDWFDVNTSPNSPTTAQMTEALMLPALQYDILNNHVNSTNAWQLSHHLTKSGEFSGNYTFWTAGGAPTTPSTITSSSSTTWR